MPESLDQSTTAVNSDGAVQTNGQAPVADDIDIYLREIIDDLWWAEAQYATGAWDSLPAGSAVAVVNKQAVAVGFATDLVVKEAADKASVPEERVALFKIFDPTTF
jgi:hypothetical protein